jgi:hypothetical protein
MSDREREFARKAVRFRDTTNYQTVTPRVAAAQGLAIGVPSGADDRNRTNTIGKNEELLPALCSFASLFSF